MKRIRAFALACIIASTFTCGDNDPTTSTESGPGWISLELTTQVTDAGGLLVTIRGKVDSIRSNSHDAFVKQVGPLAKVAVVGNLTSGAIAELFVPDASLAVAGYTASVDQAAARTLEQRDSADFAVAVSGQ